MRNLFRVMVVGIVNFGVASTGALAQPGGIKPYITYNQDRLEVFFRAVELKPQLDRMLATLPLGELHKTESEYVTIRNPRVAFKDGAITVRIDYSAGRRGWTEVPAPTLQNPKRKVKTYTPWVSDTGWLEVDFRTKLVNWVVSTETWFTGVRWSSRNQFTNIVGKMFDLHARMFVAGKVNDAIRSTVSTLPGGTGQRADLRTYMLDSGAKVISRQISVDEARVRNAMAQAFGRVQLDARCKSDGILIAVSLPRGLFAAGGASTGPSSLGPAARNEFVTMTGGRFVKLSGGDWLETGKDGTRRRFKQMAQLPNSNIVLFDDQRRMYVLLTANKGLWRSNESPQWKPWPGSDGRWVR